MLTLNIYDVENGDLDDNKILVAKIYGDDNNECERKAADKYWDTDKYAWSYAD